jgi:superfamily II DNA/RNA helicase
MPRMRRAGKRKGFYCLAVNLLTLTDLKSILEQIDKKIKKQDIPLKDTIELVIQLFESMAKRRNIDVRLRKKRRKEDQCTGL